MKNMDIKGEFAKREKEILAQLQGLIKIPSIAGERSGDYPFGLPVHQAFRYMLDLGQSMGFTVKNVDNYGGHIDFPGEEDGMVGVVCHIDVVPQGDGWSKDPFGGEIQDGWIYGRGTQDDKGGTIISLYAMYILKEMGFRPKKTIRLILGLDEETNWEGIKYYLEKEPSPEFGIVPDADFPLVQCEKGLLQFELEKKKAAGSGGSKGETLEMVSLTGGTAANVVAGVAEATIRGGKIALDEMVVDMTKKANEKERALDISREEGEIILRVRGKTAHAATPEKGNNAISILMDLLAGVEFSHSETNELIEFYRSKIGFATDGSKMGCALSDRLSGDLTFNVGKILVDQETMRLTIDTRYPVTKSKEDVLAGIRPTAGQWGWEILETDHIGSIYLDEEDPRLIILLDTYRRISGDTVNKPTIIGGATFARAVPNCVAFGPLFPGDPELEHEKDEGVEISRLFLAGEIYAEALYQLTK